MGTTLVYNNVDTLQIDFRIPFRIEPNRTTNRDEFIFETSTGIKKCISYENKQNIEKYFYKYRNGEYNFQVITIYLSNYQTLNSQYSTGIDVYTIKPLIEKSKSNKKLLLI